MVIENDKRLIKASAVPHGNLIPAWRPQNDRELYHPLLRLLIQRDAKMFLNEGIPFGSPDKKS